jgi:hypothetical protein
MRARGGLVAVMRSAVVLALARSKRQKTGRRRGNRRLGGTGARGGSGQSTCESNATARFFVGAPPATDVCVYRILGLDAISLAARIHVDDE